MTITSTELERQATELAEKAEQQRAEEARAAAEAEARRDELTEQWYREQQNGDMVGTIDAAWQKFVDAVKNDGNALAAWRNYRVTFRTMRARMRTVWQYFDRRDRDRAQAIVDQFHTVRKERNRLRSVQVPRDVSAEQWQADVEVWRKAASAYVGRDCSDVNPLDDDFELPLPPHLPVTLGGGDDLADPRGGDTFDHAVTVVVRQLEEQAVRDDAASREAELETYIAEHQ